MKPKKLSSIFLTAAEIQDLSVPRLGAGCCRSIAIAAGLADYGRTHTFFNRLFEPLPHEEADGRYSPHSYFMVLKDELGSTEEVNNRRVLALLFAAEVAKSEGL